jgi:transcription initiation factor TFIID subunit TAF12|tara:strand:- start:950 stop:1105 length:156 start_codon:yes stop_codon:yes gene_type:complete
MLVEASMGLQEGTTSKETDSQADNHRGLVRNPYLLLDNWKRILRIRKKQQE